jgi:hypothetical protein
MEQWRDIPGFEGYYQASDLGQIRSVDRVVPDRDAPRKLKGRILATQVVGCCGHLRVTLSKHGTHYDRLVHRLVALVWIGPCPAGQECRHGPNGGSDNSVANLCYGTHSENCLDMRRDNTHGGRAVRRDDGKEFISLHVAAEESGSTYKNIWSVCNNRRHTAGGYGWEYV